jgi:hypothetical protein
MAARFSAAGAFLAVLIIAGCGGSSGKSANASAESERAAPAALGSLPSRVLRAGELAGFTPQGRRILGVNAQSWVQGLELPPSERDTEAARLVRAGFLGGVRSTLAPTNGGGAEAISLAEQFKSPHTASSELTRQLQGLVRRGGVPFSVPGVPGAHGIAISTTERSGLNVEFSKGPYFYVIGVGWPGGTSHPPSRAALIAAAQHLYARG